MKPIKYIFKLYPTITPNFNIYFILRIHIVWLANQNNPNQQGYISHIKNNWDIIWIISLAICERPNLKPNFLKRFPISKKGEKRKMRSSGVCADFIVWSQPMQCVTQFLLATSLSGGMQTVRERQFGHPSDS